MDDFAKSIMARHLQGVQKASPPTPMTITAIIANVFGEAIEVSLLAINFRWEVVQDDKSRIFRYIRREIVEDKRRIAPERQRLIMINPGLVAAKPPRLLVNIGRAEEKRRKE